MLRAGFFFVMIIASVRAFSIGGMRTVSPQIGGMRTVSPQPLLRSSPLTMRNGGPSKSRFGDDGTREEGIAIGDGISDKILSSPLAGFFDGFKWGTNVEVGPADKQKVSKKGMARDNSDRGLSGNQSYRNTESARFMGGDPGKEIRKAKLDAYINSEAPAADKTFGKIIAGSLILTLIALLCGVVAYYGVDGLISAPTRTSFR